MHETAHVTSLQERRDAQTRAEISTAAIGLFAAHGFVETTMEDVAVAAGVSRRTVYRHYSNKEDLILEHPNRWLNVFRATTADREPGMTTRSACERGVLAVAALIEATRDDVLPAYGVVASTPSLGSSLARTNRQWLEAYTEVLAADSPPDDTAAAVRASVIAGALVGGTDRALAHWFMNSGTSLIELTELVLETVAPLWAPTRSM